MRIVYLSSSRIPSREANSIHVMRMCDALCDLGHDVVLVARRAHTRVANAHEWYGTRSRFRIVRLPWPAGPAGSIVYGLGVLAYLCTHRRPDLVFGRNLQGLLAAAVLRLSLIYESHAPPASAMRRRAECWLARRRHLKAVVLISRALLKRYCDAAFDFPASRAVVAPDAADLPTGRRLDSVPDWPGRLSALQVGYSGHLYEGRGIDILVALGKALRGIDFHIVGGADEDLMRWRARDLPDNVRFHGFVDPRDVACYLNRCDVLVAPYQARVAVHGGGDTSEWMSPLKLFEYMAAGKAIVASKLPAIEEILEDGRNAILVPPRDVDAWAAALRRLEEDPGLRASLGRCARADVEAKHTWRKRAELILDRALSQDEACRINVLHVLSSSGLGGTEVSTLRLATETRAALATEFCLLASPGPISEEIERAGFACRHIPIASPASAIRALPALFRLLRRSDVEVVQTYGMRAHLLVRLVGRLAGRRCIVGGLRSLEGTSDRGRPWLWLDRLTFGLSRGYISNSDAALERFAGRGYPRSRLWRIHNGIDLDEFRPATEDERAAARRDLGIDSRLTVLTCVANLRPIKNHRTLVRALELIDGDAVLLLIGDGPLRAELEAQVASADLERHVRFVGRVDTAQLPTWLGATDVCVLASDAEGLPTSLLEAMASGVPVIATAVGGVPEIVADGETGVLVPPRDEIRLAQAIGRLVADREARERMGRAGRERAVRQFGLVQMAEAYVALYRQLLASSSTGRALRRRSGSRKIPAPEENGARRDRS